MNIKKEHCNVSTIGHIDHGKTTLAEALTKYLSIHGSANYKKYVDIDNAPEERARGITINASHIEYETNKRHYSHTDCPGHADYIKNMIVGSASIDGSILVISAIDGIMPQTREHVLLASSIGIKKIIVFINKMDKVNEDDLILVDMIEEDVTALCQKHKYNEIKIVRGSAKGYVDGDTGEYGEQAIAKLVNLLDNYFEPAPALVDYPLLFTVEASVSISGRGTVATGKVIRGKIDLRTSKEEKVEVVGANKKDFSTVITSMEIFRKPHTLALPGDDMGVLLRGVKKEDINRGDIICAPKSITKSNQFKCEFYAITFEEGGRKKPFKINYKPQFYFRTLDVTGSFEDIGDAEFVNPGDIVTAKIKLNYSIPLEKNLKFIVREGGRTIGAGTVSEELPEIV